MDGKTEFAKSLNSYLDVLQRKVYEARKNLSENDYPITAENIKTLLLGKEISVHKYMLMEVFKHHNDQMAALVGIEYAPGTLERYTTSFNHTRSFLVWKYQVSDLDITQLNYEFISEYEFWLKSVRKCDHMSTNLLHFFDMLKRLISAVYSIVKKNTTVMRAKQLMPSGSPDITQYHLYCGPYDQLEAWDFFPRSLSAKEYYDPYKALQKFTKWHSKQEWQMTLRYILSYALGNSSLSELGVNLELVRISELLQKMLEACHLIYVRTAIQPQKP